MNLRGGVWLAVVTVGLYGTLAAVPGSVAMLRITSTAARYAYDGEPELFSPKMLPSAMRMRAMRGPRVRCASTVASLLGCGLGSITSSLTAGRVT